MSEILSSIDDIISGIITRQTAKKKREINIT